MNYKEEAKELVEKMHKYQEGYLSDDWEWAKQSALVSISDSIKRVNEIIERIDGLSNEGDWFYSSLLEDYIKDYIEIGNEIIKI